METHKQKLESFERDLREFWNGKKDAPALMMYTINVYTALKPASGLVWSEVADIFEKVTGFRPQGV